MNGVRSVPLEVKLLAGEFRRAISDWILPPLLSAEELAYMSAIAPPLLDSFADRLSASCPAFVSADRVRAEKDFVHRYIHLHINGKPLRLLVRVSPKGGRYNLPGKQASIALQFMTDTNERLPAEFEPVALACEMKQTRNRAGSVGLRRFANLPPGLGTDAAAHLGADLADTITGPLSVS